jgi:hypothetical protein
MCAPELSPDAVQALKGTLVADGVDLTASTHVHEWSFNEAFLLTQSFSSVSRLSDAVWVDNGVGGAHARALPPGRRVCPA